jgi:hypothetical protein
MTPVEAPELVTGRIRELAAAYVRVMGDGDGMGDAADASGTAGAQVLRVEEGA